MPNVFDIMKAEAHCMYDINLYIRNKIMAKLTKSQHSAVSTLAIAYHAFNEASAKQNINGIIIWGRALLESQQKLDVELVEQWVIDNKITVALTNEVL